MVFKRTGLTWLSLSSVLHSICIWIAQWSKRDGTAFGMQKVTQHTCNRSMVSNNELDNAYVLLCSASSTCIRQWPRTFQLDCLIWFIYWNHKMYARIIFCGLSPKMWYVAVRCGCDGKGQATETIEITCLWIENASIYIWLSITAFWYDSPYEVWITTVRFVHLFAWNIWICMRAIVCLVQHTVNLFVLFLDLAFSECLDTLWKSIYSNAKCKLLLPERTNRISMQNFLSKPYVYNLGTKIIWI